MEQFKRTNKMLGQWINMEHYRLHCVEGWADSPHKQAVLAGIRCALERLQAALPPDGQLQCMVCASRRRVAVLQFPSPSHAAPVLVDLAA